MSDDTIVSFSSPALRRVEPDAATRDRDSRHQRYGILSNGRRFRPWDETPAQHVPPIYLKMNLM